MPTSIGVWKKTRFCLESSLPVDGDLTHAYTVEYCIALCNVTYKDVHFSVTCEQGRLHHINDGANAP